jgi:hypothetical protein
VLGYGRRYGWVDLWRHSLITKWILNISHYNDDRIATADVFTCATTPQTKRQFLCPLLDQRNAKVYPPLLTTCLPPLLSKHEQKELILTKGFSYPPVDGRGYYISLLKPAQSGL